LTGYPNEINRLPRRLKPGDTIGIAAPAGPFDRGLFHRGTRVLEEMGFNVFMPEGLFEVDGYLAGDDDHRARLVNELFADNNVHAVMCARGGYGCMRILPLLDYPTIKNNPKVFMGFSDITALLSVLLSRCGLVSFHGPVVTSLAEASGTERQALLEAVSSAGPFQIRAPDGITLSPGSESGILCGGNLTILCHLVGTPFAPDFVGKILFLEDRGEAPYRIDRMLVHMKLAGCFDDLAGLVLGLFKDCGQPEDIFRIVGDVFGDCHLPILAGLEVGHGNLNLTLPVGVEATLDADRRVLSYHRAATTD